MNNNMNGFNPNPMDPMNNGMMPNNPNPNPNPMDPMTNNNMEPNVVNNEPAPMNDGMMPNNTNPNPMDPMMNNNMEPNIVNNEPAPMNNGMMPNNPNPMNPMGPQNNGMKPNPMGMNQNMMNNGMKPGKKFNPLFIAIPAVIVVVAIVVFLLVGGGNSYKDPIELYCKGTGNFDIETLKKAVPEEYLDDLDGDEQESFDDMKEYLDKAGIEMKYSCDISDDYEELSKSELKELNDDFQDSYDTKREIKKAYRVEVTQVSEMTYEGETEKDEEEVTYIVGKIDGKWYYIDQEYDW